MKSKTVHRILTAILVFAMVAAMLPVGVLASEEVTSWDFRLAEYTGQAEYNGLQLTGNFAKHDTTYGVRMTGGTFEVPVSGPCQITVSVGYNWDITFPDGSNFTHNSSDPVVYNHTGGAGTVTITVGTSCTSYIAKIELAELQVEAEPATSWDFSADDFVNGGYTGGAATYNGLKWTNGKVNKTYLLSGEGTVSVPVSGPCVVTVGAYYDYEFSFEDSDEVYTEAGTGTYTYEYNGEAGYVTINVLSTTYFTKIEVTAKSEPVTAWDFRLDEYTGQTSYNGLIISGTPAKHDANYGMRVKSATIAVPVSGACEILVGVGYQWDITFPDGTVNAVTSGNGGMNTVSYDYNGEAGTVIITAGDSCTTYISSIEVVAKDVSEIPALDPNKIYVWDFGAEALAGEQYVNMLTVDEINSWYAEGTAVGTGVNIATFESSDGLIGFNDGGKSATHRLRSTNEALIRYDNKSLTDADGNVYTGYIYSNSSSTDTVYVSIKVNAGEKVVLAVGSNGGDSLINFESPTGSVTTGQFLSGGAKIRLLTFYPTESGEYKIYSTTEKLVLARIYREAYNDITVSGNVTAPAELSGYSVQFTNTLSGIAYTAEVKNGAYSVTLKDGYSYDLSLLDANGYVIASDHQLTFEKGCGNTAADITVEAVDLVTVTGNIVGISEDALAKISLSFTADAIYIPQITVSGSTYTAVLEKGMTYRLTVGGINDYDLASEATLCYEADATADIVLKAKPVYAVTIAPEGAAAADLTSATFTFTNLNEEGYVYTFVGTENIALRDGVYSVKVTNSGAFVQKLTSNVKVEGSAVTKTVRFTDDITEWDFSNPDFTGEGSGFQGLVWTNAVKNKTYLLAKDGTVSIPVKGDCIIKVSACYQYSFYFVSEEEASVDQKTGSTGQIDTFTFIYTGEAGVVELNVLGTSYITKIEVVEPVDYSETVTVGKDGDYATINAAMDAVRKMARPNNERVTILIQPGNYEEMLVVDVPNVTLKNASETPSIGLTNKGVDIEENAVRITWYYGHGYTYYSMGSDCKFDADILQVNKENGYPSFENPGAGTTSGSYWNSTVVIYASGFQAEGIIFENSFNQYISAAAANDILVKQGGAKEGSVARADMEVGSTLVQDKTYVERAGALAIANNCTEIYFENCKFIGRQDTLYGGTGVTAAFNECAIYGGTDYIYGGMTAVFNQCDLVFNTSENKNDVGYITAAQTPAGSRGFLFYSCRITSTTPGVDTASEYTSKPGYLGRPWAANTGEAVFYNTVIDAADPNWSSSGASLISAAGWLSTLSGESSLCGEYGTVEKADVDNSGNRVSWATVFETAVLGDGTPITIAAFLGEWDAFACKHGNTELKNAKAAKCEETGYTGDTYCTDCGELVKAGEEIPASGHSYGEDGNCAVCGNPKTGDVFGIMVALMAASGTALVVLKKKED